MENEGQANIYGLGKRQRAVPARSPRFGGVPNPNTKYGGRYRAKCNTITRNRKCYLITGAYAFGFDVPPIK